MFQKAEVTGRATLRLSNIPLFLFAFMLMVSMEMAKQVMNLAKYRELCPAKTKWFQVSSQFSVMTNVQAAVGTV
jgi:hypothetical protein